MGKEKAKPHKELRLQDQKMATTNRWHMLCIPFFYHGLVQVKNLIIILKFLTPTSLDI
jgi:hypothetical protein